MAHPDISKKEAAKLEKERNDLSNSMKVKFKELKRYDKSNKTKAVVAYVQFVNMKAQERFLKTMNVNWCVRFCSRKHDHK